MKLPQILALTTIALSSSVASANPAALQSLNCQFRSVSGNPAAPIIRDYQKSQNFRYNKPTNGSVSAQVVFADMFGNRVVTTHGLGGGFYPGTILGYYVKVYSATNVSKPIVDFWLEDAPKRVRISYGENDQSTFVECRPQTGRTPAHL